MTLMFPSAVTWHVHCCSEVKETLNGEWVWQHTLIDEYASLETQHTQESVARLKVRTSVYYTQSLYTVHNTYYSGTVAASRAVNVYTLIWLPHTPRQLLGVHRTFQNP